MNRGNPPDLIKQPLVGVGIKEVGLKTIHRPDYRTIVEPLTTAGGGLCFLAVLRFLLDCLSSIDIQSIHGSKFSRRRNREDLPPAVLEKVSGHRKDRASQTRSPEPGNRPARLGRHSRPSVRSSERRPQRAIQHPHQRSIPDLLPLDRWRRLRCRNYRLPLRDYLMPKLIPRSEE